MHAFCSRGNPDAPPAGTDPAALGVPVPAPGPTARLPGALLAGAASFPRWSGAVPPTAGPGGNRLSSGGHHGFSQGAPGICNCLPAYSFPPVEIRREAIAPGSGRRGGWSSGVCSFQGWNLGAWLLSKWKGYGTLAARAENLVPEDPGRLSKGLRPWGPAIFGSFQVGSDS